MPDMDGFAVAARIAAAWATFPSSFCRRLSDVETKVEGLTLYAEDYVTKPFALAELLARVRRILLRAGTRIKRARTGDDHRRAAARQLCQAVRRHRRRADPADADREPACSTFYTTTAGACCHRATSWRKRVGPRAQGQRGIVVGAHAAAAQPRLEPDARSTRATSSRCAGKGIACRSANQTFEDDTPIVDTD
jgi:CheY-like chemotaxis protein